MNWIEGSKVYPSQLFGSFYTANENDRTKFIERNAIVNRLTIVEGMGIFLYVYIRKEEWHLHKDGEM